MADESSTEHPPAPIPDEALDAILAEADVDMPDAVWHRIEATLTIEAGNRAAADQLTAAPELSSHLAKRWRRLRTEQPSD